MKLSVPPGSIFLSTGPGSIFKSHSPVRYSYFVPDSLYDSANPHFIINNPSNYCLPQKKQKAFGMQNSNKILQSITLALLSSKKAADHF